MGHRAQKRAGTPEEAEGSHPPPRHQLYPGTAMNERYKEALRAVSKDAQRLSKTRSTVGQPDADHEKAG